MNFREVRRATITAPHYDNERQLLHGAVYDATGAVVTGSLRDCTGLAWQHGDPPTLTEPPVDPTRLVSGRYLGRYMMHFGHFIVETLPNLAHAGESGDLLFHPWPETFPAELRTLNFRGYFLDALCVRRERIRFVTRPAFIETLTIPSRMPNVIGGVVDDATLDAYARVREYATARASRSSSPAAIYLSRNGYRHGRSIPHEDRREAEFSGRGYTVIRPHELHIEQQIALVGNASRVAGVDGSALHLCGFMRPGGEVTVITEGRKLNRALLAVNAALDLNTVEVVA